MCGTEGSVEHVFQFPGLLAALLLMATVQSTSQPRFAGQLS
jgi:hypothetical protein